MSTADVASFEELVDLIRRRLGIADVVNSGLHSMKVLMRDHADVIVDHWYWRAFEELQAQGHLHAASAKVFGGDAVARLSADGHRYLSVRPASPPRAAT